MYEYEAQRMAMELERELELRRTAHLAQLGEIDRELSGFIARLRRAFAVRRAASSPAAGAESAPATRVSHGAGAAGPALPRTYRLARTERQ